jgi:hypothetical protein
MFQARRRHLSPFAGVRAGCGVLAYSRSLRKSPNDILTLAGLDSKQLNTEEDVHGESAAIH